MNIGKVKKTGKLKKIIKKEHTFIDQIQYFFFSKCPPRAAMHTAHYAFGPVHCAVNRSKRRSKFPMVHCSVAWGIAAGMFQISSMASKTWGLPAWKRSPENYNFLR